MHSFVKCGLTIGIGAAALILAACGITTTPPEGHIQAGHTNAGHTQAQQKTQAVQDPQAVPYSLINKITLQDGRRAEFTALLYSVLKPSNCISCRLIADKLDPNVLWVSETWPSEAAHDDALKTPQALAALKAGRPMVVKMERMADSGP